MAMFSKSVEIKASFIMTLYNHTEYYTVRFTARFHQARLRRITAAPCQPECLWFHQQHLCTFCATALNIWRWKSQDFSERRQCCRGCFSFRQPITYERGTRHPGHQKNGALFLFFFWCMLESSYLCRSPEGKMFCVCVFSSQCFCSFL